MQYEQWAPVYERIRTRFGFDWERERASAARLRSLLPPDGPPVFPAIVERLKDREVVVVGQAPGAGPPPVWRLVQSRPPPAIVAADGATVPCLDAGLVPDVVVTDLDGPVPSEVVAVARGAIAVVHAHGDNAELIRRWVPEFRGPVLGTWAGAPTPPLLDLGGFTDGDRAAYLAEAAGARRVLLWGFDLGRVDPALPDAARKLEKLRWAAVSLEHLASLAPGRIFTWQRDARIEPYGAGRAAASTQSTDSAPFS